MNAIQFGNKKILGSKSEKNSTIKEFLVPYPEEENVINDTNLEIDTLKKHFTTSLDREKKTKKDQITANYFFTVYFQNEEQKNRFFKLAKLSEKTKGLFLSGFDLAEAMGIEIKKEEIKIPKHKKTFEL